MKRYCLVLFCLFGLFAIPVLKAQTAEKQASVKVTGEVTTPLDLKLSDLQQYPQTEVIRKDRDGKDHTYSGVILSEILQKAGVTLGKDLRGENLTKFVLVEASDGYQVVFALAELDKDFTDRTIILASTVDGKPLLPADGPFRIIVQNEKKPARCIKQVTNIKVQFAK
ncbi:MAG TPA: molybdopterin-dependent oxidoreductase [Mucilaginibacter sp.]|jgi:DMSO/TMAO reductase YedYZ molybdopterin-dependent catalytic subunit